jgi:hypothetical protein
MSTSYFDEKPPFRGQYLKENAGIGELKNERI